MRATCDVGIGFAQRQSFGSEIVVMLPSYVWEPAIPYLSWDDLSRTWPLSQWERSVFHMCQQELPHHHPRTASQPLSWD